jgi:hypothetical protein
MCFGRLYFISSQIKYSWFVEVKYSYNMQQKITEAEPHAVAPNFLLEEYSAKHKFPPQSIGAEVSTFKPRPKFSEGRNIYQCLVPR